MNLSSRFFFIVNLTNTKTKKMKNTQETFDETMREQTPLCLKHWNWGAFALPGIWSIFNRVWWAMILQALVFASPIAQLSVKLVLDLAIMTYMGWQGNRIAWDCAKKRMSAEDLEQSRHYRDCCFGGTSSGCAIL